MGELASNRTSKADGSVIVKLRRARGWSQEELLRQIQELSRRDKTVAKIGSLKTISSAEKGKEAYFATLNAIAGALDVSLCEILANRSESSVPNTRYVPSGPNDRRPSLGGASNVNTDLTIDE
jgi:transcriptional regulator with XRE-family HTH domain